MTTDWVTEITTMEEYDYLTAHGYEPLLDKRFSMPVVLRVEIQTRLFGKGHSAATNERYFRWVWNHKPHYCEECMKPLNAYSAVYCSHILTRGGNPECAHDVRNINILCFRHHSQWENGDKENMRIYSKNQRTIETLRKEYVCSKKSEQ